MLPEHALSSLPGPALRLKIDGDALAANWRALNRLSGAARAGAAVKADAYGLGARQAVPVLAEAGCVDFFVAHWSEAATVAPLLPHGALSVLHGVRNAQEAAFARATGVRPVLNTPEQARLWSEAGGGVCHLMVDTGMNRLGFAPADLAEPVVAGLDVDVLLSHLASAEEDSALNERQRLGWLEARGQVRHRRASLANSAGIALGEGYHGDLTRPGLALYGGIPCAALAGEIVQVARPQAALLQVREVAARETVGYNATFTATHSMRVGTVALGYADGYLRCWSGKGVLMADGARLPVLGRVSMDMTVVDLSAAPHLREGDWLDVQYALPEAAATSGLSQYELLTLLGARFGR